MVDAEEEWPKDIHRHQVFAPLTPCQSLVHLEESSPLKKEQVVNKCLDAEKGQTDTVLRHSVNELIEQHWRKKRVCSKGLSIHKA